MAHVPVGIFRNVERPTYDDLVRAQVTTASADGPPTTEALQSLIAGNDTWTVGGGA